MGSHEKQKHLKHTEMIELKDFSAGYEDRNLLNRVNLKLDKGTVTALIGRNGSGKSTLLRTIAGLNGSYLGSVLINGRDIKKMTRAEMARSISVVTTERIRIRDLKCRDAVALGRSPYTGWRGKYSREDEEAVNRALETAGMENYAMKSLDRLSDGECQRIMIARALAQDTPAILLDEPTSFLDIPAREEICLLLQRLAHENGKCILFSTHELGLAMRTCDSIALIGSGNLYHFPAKEMEESGLLNMFFGIKHI